MRVGRVALTGGIATGKSTVRAIFDALGVPTSDGDALAREAVAPGSPGLAAVVARFGAGVRDASGALDRKALGAIVFADSDARRDLERIVHPLVQARTTAWLDALDAHCTPYAVADIPLLFEIGRERDFDAVIVAACDERTQLARLRARDGLSEDEAKARVAAQWPLDTKRARADYVIETGGTRDETVRQTEAVARQLRVRHWE